MTRTLHRRQSLADQLTDELRQLIDDGTFKPGDRLPSENDLIKQYGVSRTVVREAIAGLRADELLETRQGVGAFVTGGLSKRLERFDPKDLDQVLQVLEFRIAFETDVAGLAAERRTEEDLVFLKRKFDDLAAHAFNPESFAHPDFEFHLAIARVSHNPYFYSLEQHLGPQIIPHTKLHVLLPDIPEDREFMAEVHQEHEEIFNAIVAGDPDRATEAIKVHLHHSIRLYSQYL